MYIHSVPEASGCTIWEAQMKLPTATVVGVVDLGRQVVKINPPNDLVVGPTDELIVVRPVASSYD